MADFLFHVRRALLTAAIFALFSAAIVVADSSDHLSPAWCAPAVGLAGFFLCFLTGCGVLMSVCAWWVAYAKRREGFTSLGFDARRQVSELVRDELDRRGVK